MKKEPSPRSAASKSRADHRTEQRHQTQSQAAQLSAANVEESPHMDRRDSAGGAGQSLGEAPAAQTPGEQSRRGALDTQYGTVSTSKTGPAGRASSGGSGPSDAAATAPQAPNPGNSEASSGSDRDTMTGSRPGSGS